MGAALGRRPARAAVGEREDARACRKGRCGSCVAQLCAELRASGRVKRSVKKLDDTAMLERYGPVDGGTLTNLGERLARVFVYLGLMDGTGTGVDVVFDLRGEAE
jgi:hypothetical protein